MASAPSSQSDDRELLRRYHAEGDRGARELLVQRHLPLVRALARRYAGRGESLEDIEQVGAIGLIKAIDRYELSRDVALTTYATPNVVGEIKRHFRDKGWAIRIPRGLQELNAKMSSTIERLTAKLGHSPSIAEIALELQTTPEQVLEAMEAGSAYAPVSLSAGPSGEGELDPMETIGTEDSVPRWSRRSSCCPIASAKSCACGSRTGSPRPRLPSRWGSHRCTFRASSGSRSRGCAPSSRKPHLNLASTRNAC